MADVVRWVFDDPATLETVTLEVNPSEGGSPQYAKQIEFQPTAAPDGNVLAYEGRDQAQQLDFSGTILTEDQYNTLFALFDKRHQIQVTDDLGRVFMIYIMSFEPKRQRAIHFPWKHTYTVKYFVLDWPT